MWHLAIDAPIGWRGGFNFCYLPPVLLRVASPEWMSTATLRFANGCDFDNATVCVSPDCPNCRSGSLPFSISPGQEISMPRRLAVSFVVAGLLGSSLAANALADDDVFNEPFEEKLAQKWLVIRPDDERRSLDAVPGALQITTQFGSIHGKTNEGEKARNIMLLDRSIPTGQDFEATLKVSEFSPVTYYHQVAVVAYQGDDDYAKFSLERSWSDNATDNLVMVLERAQETQHHFVTKKEIDGPFWLRISRDRVKYAVWYSNDGEQFEKIGETVWTPSKADEPIRAGFLAKNGGNPEAKEINVLIEDFRLKLKPVKGQPDSAAKPVKAAESTAD